MGKSAGNRKTKTVKKRVKKGSARPTQSFLQLVSQQNVVSMRDTIREEIKNQLSVVGQQLRDGLANRMDVQLGTFNIQLNALTELLLAGEKITESKLDDKFIEIQNSFLGLEVVKGNVEKGDHVRFIFTGEDGSEQRMYISEVAKEPYEDENLKDLEEKLVGLPQNKKTNISFTMHGYPAKADVKIISVSRKPKQEEKENVKT